MGTVMIKTLTEKKILYLFSIQFLLILISAFLTSATKIIVPQDNHHVLSSMVLWGWPLLLITTLLYFWTANRYNTQKLLKIFLGGFFVLFVVCSLSMTFYEHSHISFETYTSLVQQYPGFKGIIDSCRNWSEILLSILTESFYFVFINVFFWQLVIDSTNPLKAKVIYPFFGFVSGINLLICSLIEPFLLSHNLIIAYGIWFLLGAILILQRKISPFIQTKKSQKENLPILESFGYIFTSSSFSLMTGLTFLFFVIMGLLHFLGINSFLLFVFYGFIQLGYLLLPINIRAKSKMIIDSLFSIVFLWATGYLLKMGLMLHVLKKVEFRGFVNTLIFIFVGAFILLSYKLLKNLNAHIKSPNAGSAE